jgi:hypothetical protein
MISNRSNGTQLDSKEEMEEKKSERVVNKAATDTLVLRTLEMWALKTATVESQLKILRAEIDLEKDAETPNDDRLKLLTAQREKMQKSIAWWEILDQDKKNVTLCIAAYKGWLKTTAYLLDHQADLTCIIPREQWMRVILFLKAIQAEVHKCHVSSITSPYLDQLALFLQSMRELVEVKEEKGTEFNASSITDQHPFQLAVKAHHFDVAECLRMRGADIADVYVRLDDGFISFFRFPRIPRPPNNLFFAAHTGDIEAANYLINLRGGDRRSDLDAQDLQGNTVLHLAAAGNHLALVKLFLERKANPTLMNHKDRTAAEVVELKASENISAEIKEMIKVSQQAWNEAHKPPKSCCIVM